MSNLLDLANIVLTPTAYSDNKVHCVKPVESTGDDVVVNGGFDTDTNWQKDSGWSISGGQAVCDGTQSSFAFIQQQFSSGFFVIGETYELTFTMTSYTGGGILSIGFGTYPVSTTSGATVFDLGAGANTTGTYTVTAQISALGPYDSLFMRSTPGGKTPAFIGAIDNVIIKKITKADFSVQNNNTTRTRLNSNNIIESINPATPHLDYLDVGHWLIEYQSTNTATYSNDFTQGDVFNASSNPGLDATVLTSQQATSPDGTNNAWLLKDDNSGGTGTPNLRYFGTTVNSNDFNTFSIFAKKALTNDFIALATASFDSSANGNTWFNISNGTLGNVNSNHTAKIEDYGNGWYRCQITFKTTTDVQGAIRIRLSSTNGDINSSLDGTNGSYIFGLQCEASTDNNLASSYIPTNGVTVTRGFDSQYDALGQLDQIPQEGVFYVEVAALANNGTSRNISINDDSTNNKVCIELDQDSNKIKAFVTAQGSGVGLTHTVSDVTQFTKIAVKYKSGDLALWVDGNEVAVASNTVLPIGMDRIETNNGGTFSQNRFHGKIKCITVFSQVLTDEQLTCLTT